jgi:hypothetical protein
LEGLETAHKLNIKIEEKITDTRNFFWVDIS